jgi:hypothetical protein
MKVPTILGGWFTLAPPPKAILLPYTKTTPVVHTERCNFPCPCWMIGSFGVAIARFHLLFMKGENDIAMTMKLSNVISFQESQI